MALVTGTWRVEYCFLNIGVVPSRDAVTFSSHKKLHEDESTWTAPQKSAPVFRAVLYLGLYCPILEKIPISFRPAFAHFSQSSSVRGETFVILTDKNKLVLLSLALSNFTARVSGVEKHFLYNLQGFLSAFVSVWLCYAAVQLVIPDERVLFLALRLPYMASFREFVLF